MKSHFGRSLSRLGCSFLLFALVAVVGCAEGGKKNVVSGKVTLNSQPVDGEVVFTGPGNKVVSSPITPEGTYTIMDAAAGENTIQVRKMGLGGPVVKQQPPPGVKDGKMQGVDPSTMLGGGKSKGVEPPAKYAAPTNGLKYTVKGGKETFNIELTP